MCAFLDLKITAYQPWIILLWWLYMSVCVDVVLLYINWCNSISDHTAMFFCSSRTFNYIYTNQMCRSTYCFTSAQQFIRFCPKIFLDMLKFKHIRFIFFIILIFLPFTISVSDIPQNILWLIVYSYLEWSIQVFAWIF